MSRALVGQRQRDKARPARSARRRRLGRLARNAWASCQLALPVVAGGTAASRGGADNSAGIPITSAMRLSCAATPRRSPLPPRSAQTRPSRDARGGTLALSAAGPLLLQREAPRDRPPRPMRARPLVRAWAFPRRARSLKLALRAIGPSASARHTIVIALARRPRVPIRKDGTRPAPGRPKPSCPHFGWLGSVTPSAATIPTKASRNNIERSPCRVVFMVRCGRPAHHVACREG